MKKKYMYPLYSSCSQKNTVLFQSYSDNFLYNVYQMRQKNVLIIFLNINDIQTWYCPVLFLTIKTIQSNIREYS